MSEPADASMPDIDIRVTERGLPVALKLGPRQLSKSPAELARDILLTCRLQAAQAQVARRRELQALGVDAAVVSALRLSTEEDLLLARQQLAADDDGTTPDSWLRPV